jgi:pimeloyl-ACP methyl ester carboxylesterase
MTQARANQRLTQRDNRAAHSPRTRSMRALLAPVALLALCAVSAGLGVTPPRVDAGADRDTISEWRDRLLMAAEEAEAHLAALLDGSFGRADASDPVRGDPSLVARPNGLHLVAPDDTESRISADSRLSVSVVLLVHGLDEPGSIWNELIPALQEFGHTVVRLDYPNDQPAADSALLLADALATLRSAGCEHVDLVCHSMGGLLALDVLTRPDLEGARAAWPSVDRCITLGTPFGGSPFARLRAIAEVRDRLERWLESGRRDRDALLDWSSDGNGEAGDDLMPGSAYLRELTARPLPEGVAMTAVIARVAELHPPDVSGLTESWLVRRIAGEEDVESIATALRRAALEVGDGVVPESSARAVKIEDTVVVSANHRDMIMTIESLDSVRRAIGMQDGERLPPAIPVVLDRLRAERPAVDSTAAPSP